MKNIRLLGMPFLVTVSIAYNMDTNVFCDIPTDLKIGIIAQSTLKNKKNLRLVNKEFAFLACKANFAKMITHAHCILDRPHHLEFMINYSLKQDTQAHPVMTWLIKNASLCDHADVLDIASHFFPSIDGQESLIGALKGGSSSLIKGADLLINGLNCQWIIPVCMQTYKENKNNEKLLRLVMPEVMNIYGGYEVAIDRYKEKYRQGKEATTHLHLAVENGHNTVAELFIAQNPNLLCMTDAHDMTSLAIAAQKNNLAIIKMFQKACKRNNIEENRDIPFEKSPYFFAAQEGHAEALQLLLETNDSMCLFGSQSLLVAVGNAHMQTVEMLLVHPKIDRHVKNECGHNILHIATLNIPLLELLLTKCASLLNEKDMLGATPLIHVIQRNNLEIVKLLVEQPHIDINAYIEPNFELLDESFELLQKKFNITEEAITQAKEQKGFSALCYAASNGNVAMVQLLLDHGAVLYNGNRTPLMLAAQNGHYDVVKIIANHSPQNINDTNQGFTALFIAIMAKRKDIVEFLLDNGAQINMYSFTSPLKISPLLMAIEAGDFDIFKLLVERGADVNFQAVDGMDDMTPLGFAKVRERQDIIDFLLKQPSLIIK